MGTTIKLANQRFVSVLYNLNLGMYIFPEAVHYTYTSTGIAQATGTSCRHRKEDLSWIRMLKLFHQSQEDCHYCTKPTDEKTQFSLSINPVSCYHLEMLLSYWFRSKIYGLIVPFSFFLFFTSNQIYKENNSIIVFLKKYHLTLYFKKSKIKNITYLSYHYLVTPRWLIQLSKNL